MADDQNKHWRCENCDEISMECELLRAPNPFDTDKTITGCPYCKWVGDFEVLCDEPGCEEQATCGFPVKEGFGGYRRTCGNHYIEMGYKEMTPAQRGE